MYFSHFGLAQAPFSITPNPSFFYSGSSRGDILQALLYAVSHGEGIIKVTGEVGSGKTMLCRMLEANLPANVEVIFLANPSLARDQVKYVLASELKLPLEGKRPEEVTRMLQQDLIAKHIQGKQVVLLVEEAQAMSLDTLEEIRLFSNLETAHHKLLQIILFGQPELDVSLALPNMRQLKERITHSFHVPPIPADQIGDFLMFRMRQAGYSGPNIFSKGAIKQLAWVSKGIVRRINILADKAMLAAFAENASSIGPKQMRAAIKDSEFGHYHGKMLFDIGWKIALAVAMVTCIWVAFYVGKQSSEPQFAANSAAPVQATSSASAVAAAKPPAISAVHATSAMGNPSPTPTASAPAAEIKTTTPTPNNLATSTAISSASPATAPATNQLTVRLRTSQEWLQATPNERHTLQLNLVAANNHAEILRFMQKVQTESSSAAVYLYPSRLGGVARYGVLLGNFATREEAKEKMRRLQMELGYPSQIRTVGGLREEIRNSKSEDLWLAQ